MATNKERLLEILSFIPFFSYKNLKGISILDDYKFMNPEFFLKDEINSESNLTASEIWGLIELRRKDFGTRGFNLVFLYKSKLKKINVKKFILDTLLITDEDLESLFSHYFNENDVEKIKEKYDLDLRDLYDNYIKEKL